MQFQNEMPHILDNVIWNAINTGNKNIAMINEDVGCYHPEIAPFAGLQEWSNKNLEMLANFIPSGRRVAVSYDERIKFDEGNWKVLQQMDCCQMVYEKPVTNFVTVPSPLIVPLDAEHIPEMLELTALTRPGPF